MPVKRGETFQRYFADTSTPDMPYPYPYGGTLTNCKRAPNIPREESVIRRTSVLNDRCNMLSNVEDCTTPIFFREPTIYITEQALTPDDNNEHTIQKTISGIG